MHIAFFDGCIFLFIVTSLRVEYYFACGQESIAVNFIDKLVVLKKGGGG